MTQARDGRRGLRTLCALCVSLGFVSLGLAGTAAGDEPLDQLLTPAPAIAAVSTAPALEVSGETVRARNAEIVARAFDLSAALDDLVGAFRAEAGTTDLARFAVAHATGEPGPLASATAASLLLETRPPGASAVLLRGGLGLLLERHETGIVIAAWDARTGAPARGHALVVLGATEDRGGSPRRFSQLAAAPLDEAGIAIVPSDERFAEALVVVKQEDGRAAWRVLSLTAGRRDERPRVLVHWERGLVKPGEPVRALLLARRPKDGELVRVREGELLSVLLVDESGREVARKELAVDRSGGATFEAPSVRGVLGVQARVAGELARVEGGPVLALEARASTLDLALHAPAWVESGAPFTVSVEARDPLGAPVVGRVRWRLTADTVSEGAVATSASGTATIALSARKDARLDAFFDDATGREGAASVRVPVSEGPQRWKLSSERRFVGPGEDVTVDLESRGLDGRLEDAKGTAFLSKDGQLHSRAEFATKDGRARTVWKLPAAGAWDVAFVATPTRETQRVFAGEASAARLEVVREKSAFHRGEPARFLLRAPQGARALVVARDERGVRAGSPRLVPAGLFTIDLDATWAPGFEVEALSVIGGELARARVRAATVPLAVPLDLEVTADKTVYKTGEKATLRLHVQSADNIPERRASVSASLEDEDAASAAERAVGREADLLLPRRRDAPTAPPGFANASTDDAGNAQLQVTVPGEGRWRARVVVVARDGRSKAHDVTLVARRPVTLDLGVPTTMEAGDGVELLVVAHNESEKAVSLDASLVSSAPALLELQGAARAKLDVPARGRAELRVLAVARAPGRVKLDARLGDDAASALVPITAPRLGWLGATSALVGSDTVAAPGSMVALVAPAGPKLLLRVDTAASTLGDLVAELVRPGHGVDPAFAFVPAILARGALDARGMAWDVVAKRAGVDPAEPLLAGDLGKGPRDPRRTPLFTRSRVDALVRDGLAALEARAGPMGWSWRRGAAPDIESTAHALEALALAREAGVPVAPEVLDRGGGALDAYLAQPSGAGGLPSERAHAALALVLAGRPAPLDRLDAEPRDREADLLLALARLRAARDGPDAPRARERAWALLAKTPPTDATSAGRELELATLLDPGGALARSLADEVLARRPVLGISEPRVAAVLARALAEYVRRAPPRRLGGSVTVQGIGELVLHEDDPLLVGATLLRDAPAPVGTLLLARTAPGEVRVTAGAQTFEPQGGSGAVVERSFACIVRSPVATDGAVWLRARHEPLGPAPTIHRGDLVQVDLVVRAERASARFALEERIPAGFELVKATGASRDVLGDSIRFFVDLLTPGEHRFTLLLRARLAGEVRALPTRAWIDPKPGYALRNDAVSLKIVD